MPFPVFAVAGPKRSGKTKLVEALVRGLVERGYRVASAKHVPHADFTIDKEGKDTWRMARAGSSIVLSVSPREVAVIKKDDTSQYSIERILEGLEGEVDVVILEGFRSWVGDRPDIPKVLTAGSREEAEQWSKGMKNVLGVVGTFEGEVPGLPKLSEDQVLELIEARIPKKPAKTSVRIEGKPLALNPFVQEIVRKVVLGAISTLKGAEIRGDETVLLNIKRTRIRPRSTEGR